MDLNFCINRSCSDQVFGTEFFTIKTEAQLLQKINVCILFLSPKRLASQEEQFSAEAALVSSLWTPPTSKRPAICLGGRVS